MSASRLLDDLYRAHSAAVYRYAYALLGNQADAEDATQTTFVNALRALERGDRPRKPSNWLITIAHNVVRQRFRQQRARPVEVEFDQSLIVSRDLNLEPSLDELVAALQRMPWKQREAIVLRELEGRSYKEIAAILALSEGAVESVLVRARRSLAYELETPPTCERIEQEIANALDRRLTRTERKRLQEHLAQCPSCKQHMNSQRRQRHALKRLGLLPLPLSLKSFKSAQAGSSRPEAAVTSASAPAGAGAVATAAGVGISTVSVAAAVFTVAGVLAGTVVATGVTSVGMRSVGGRPLPAVLPQAAHAPLLVAVANRHGSQLEAPHLRRAWTPMLTDATDPPITASAVPERAQHDFTSAQDLNMMSASVGDHRAIVSNGDRVAPSEPPSRAARSAYRPPPTTPIRGADAATSAATTGAATDATTNVLPTICAPEAALPAVDPTVTCSAAETVPDTTDSFDTTAYDTPPTPSVQSSPNAAVDPNGSQTSTPLDAEAATHDDTDTGSPTCSASSQMSNGTSDYYNCHGDTPTADPAVAPFANTSARLASLLSVASGIGPGRSLETKILDIQTRVAAAQKTSACDALASFVNEVGAQADKQISTDQANMLTTKAEEIESALGC